MKHFRLVLLGCLSVAIATGIVESGSETAYLLAEKRRRARGPAR